MRARDRPSRYGCRCAFFFVVRGPSRLYQRDAGFPASPTLPRNRSLILDILAILAILLQTIAMKVFTDFFSLLRLRSIDIQVLSDLVPSVGGGRSARACPSPAFNCLKQDEQDL